jgi:hypothetical protein
MSNAQWARAVQSGIHRQESGLATAQASKRIRLSQDCQDVLPCKVWQYIKQQTPRLSSSHVANRPHRRRLTIPDRVQGSGRSGCNALALQLSNVQALGITGHCPLKAPCWHFTQTPPAALARDADQVVFRNLQCPQTPIHCQLKQGKRGSLLIIQLRPRCGNTWHTWRLGMQVLCIRSCPASWAYAGMCSMKCWEEP